MNLTQAHLTQLEIKLSLVQYINAHSLIGTVSCATFQGTYMSWSNIVLCGQMVNKQLHQEVFAHLRDAVRRKRPELWESQTWMLRHDNAPAHASLLICSYLAKHQTSIVPHPPCSPDLAPADFFLFPKLKTTLKGRRFQKP